MTVERRFDPKVAGLTLGIFWGVVLFVWTLVSFWTGYGGDVLKLLTSIYPGYSVGYLGSLVGLVYGFVEGFVVAFVLAWLYERLAVAKFVARFLGHEVA